MAGADPVITFLCGFCEHRIKAPAAAEGHPGRCPRCQKVVVVPELSGPVCSFHLTDDESPRLRKLRGLGHGVAVSLVLHLVVMSFLAVVLFKAKELGRAIVVTLFLDTEGSELELTDIPLEMPAPNPALVEGDAALGGDLLPYSISPGADRIAAPATGSTSREVRLTASSTASGSIDPLGRFSPSVVDRLSRQPAAKRGDYEIALFWDGPSDLDLHVRYESSSRKERRTIFYGAKGTPESGFLDVDQNCTTPYVDDPIEHIRWNSKNLPAGTYKILVHGYRLRTAGNEIPAMVQFMVEIKTPSGIASHGGFARQGMFEEIDTLEIAGSDPVNGFAKGNSQNRNAEKEGKRSTARISGTSSGNIATSTEDRQLIAAKNKLAGDDPTSIRVARVMLKNIVRKYPDSKAAKEARELLQELE